MGVESWMGPAISGWLFIYSLINPYDCITIHEYYGEYMQRDELHTAAQAYLSSTSCSSRASKLKAELSQDSSTPLVTIEVYEEVYDTFRGVKVWWYAGQRTPNSQTISLYPRQDERQYYRLTFHKRHRELVEGQYLQHILEEGRAVMAQRRRRRLFTNSPSSSWDGYKSPVWTHVAFEHPATFDTIAMDAERKREIIDDLVTFREGKEYYKQIGKSWKRGYLLYGPPGTGKSTMIAAIANFLEYDVYDLQLTAVKTDTELRKIFIETTAKSIIVIENIDSLDLTGKRKEKKEHDDEEREINLPRRVEENDESSKLTLSGVLNVIDGIWSASRGERIIIFTTNHIEKLDPALIRRGRMDMHIEMSYCNFEAFKFLAKNYLGIEKHELFDTIRTLLSEVDMTPADVAEGLMLKKSTDVGASLKSLIIVIKAAKEEVINKRKMKLLGYTCT